MKPALIKALKEMNEAELIQLRIHIHTAFNFRDIMKRHKLTDADMMERLNLSKAKLRDCLNGAYNYDLRLIASLEAYAEELQRDEVKVELISFPKYKYSEPLISKAKKNELELLTKPGDTIQDILVEKKMRVQELAKAMGMPVEVVTDIIDGQQEITKVIAEKLEKALKVDAQFWLNRQKLYDEKLAKINKMK